MRSTSRIFAVSAGFFFVVGTVYWFVSYEPAGSIMLGLWCLTLLFAASYLRAAARRGAPAGDDPNRDPAGSAGERVGLFASGSPWPVVLGAGLAIGLTGLVYGAWLSIPGAIVTIAALLGLMRETGAA